MSKVKIIPDLRFPEFEKNGEWVETTIEQVAKVTTGNKDTQNKVENGKYPFFVRSQTVERINSYSFDGEAILTSGDGVGVGKNFHYINGKFDFHQRVYCIYDFLNDVCGEFVFMFFSQHFNERVMKMSAKNSVDSVRMAMITEMPICLPSKNEQQKIASCLLSLDEVIAAHSQKLNLLKEHKKGMMQNLFPQEGEKVPKYRFKEFENDGEWVEEPLSSKVSVIDGDRGLNYPKAEEYSSDGYCLFLSAKNVTKIGFLFNEFQFITKEKDELLRKGKLARFDIVLTTRGSLGQFAFFDENIQFENIRINSGMVILRAKDNGINPNYLYSYFNSNSIQSAIKSQGFGNAVQQLTVAVINNFTLRYPYSPKEQQKIAYCLSSLDALITAQAEKIEQLKLHKKGLMQGLFPKINE